MSEEGWGHWWDTQEPQFSQALSQVRAWASCGGGYWDAGRVGQKAGCVLG